MDLVQSVLIQKILNKGRDAEILSKFRPPTPRHPVEALKRCRANLVY